MKREKLDTSKISVIGFFLYPLFRRQQKAGIKNILLFAASFISVICIFLIQERSSYRSIMIAGCLIFVLFGMAGGVIHKRAADLLASDRNLAEAVKKYFLKNIPKLSIKKRSPVRMFIRR